MLTLCFILTLASSKCQIYNDIFDIFDFFEEFFKNVKKTHGNFDILTFGGFWAGINQTLRFWIVFQLKNLQVWKSRRLGVEKKMQIV